MEKSKGQLEMDSTVLTEERIMDFSEDPYLSGELAAEMVKTMNIMYMLWNYLHI